MNIKKKLKMIDINFDCQEKFKTLKLKNYIIGKFVGSFIPYIITINMFYNFLTSNNSTFNILFYP